MELVTIGGKDILDEVCDHQSMPRPKYRHGVGIDQNGAQKYICETTVYFESDGIQNEAFRAQADSLLSEDEAANLSAIESLKILEKDHRFVIVDINYNDFRKKRRKYEDCRSLHEEVHKELMDDLRERHGKENAKVQCSLRACKAKLKEALDTVKDWDP